MCETPGRGAQRGAAGGSPTSKGHGRNAHPPELNGWCSESLKFPSLWRPIESVVLSKVSEVHAAARRRTPSSSPNGCSLVVKLARPLGFRIRIRQYAKPPSHTLSSTLLLASSPTTSTFRLSPSRTPTVVASVPPLSLPSI